MLASSTCLWTFLFAASLALATQYLTEPVSKDNSPQCDCYITSGPDPSYFQYHRFWDFRNILSTDDDDYTTAPSIVTSSDGLEPITSPFLNTTIWNNDWQIQNWSSTVSSDSPVLSVNSPQNVYISRNATSDTTYLTLRATRLADFMSIAEIDSNQANLLHSSIRARMRVIPNGLSNTSDPSSGDTALSDYGSNTSHPVDPGAVAGFFTYYSSTEESDIEILTSDPTDSIRYSNQPDFNYKTGETVAGASTDFDVPNDFDWTEWLEQRMDWHQGISRWYINDEFMMSKMENVPKIPSALFINLWGDGGDWSGNMSVGGQVQFGIEWIEMVFNVSGPVEGPGGGSDANYGGKRLTARKMQVCHVGCAIDGVANVGFPEQLFNSTGESSAARGQDVGMLPAVVFAMLGMICCWLL